jgi:hypothetical protein
MKVFNKAHLFSFILRNWNHTIGIGYFLECDIPPRAGNEPSRARLGSARCGSVADRARLGSARPFHELGRQARLGSKVARELARLGSRATP